MSLPTTFSNLVYSIETHLISGSGQYPNTIPTGSYSMQYWYENRSQGGISQDTLWKPQIKVKINSFEDSNAWLKPNTKTIYNVDIAVDIALHLDSKLLKEKRSEIETDLANRVVLIQRTLTDPQTMLTGSIGQETGLVSGRLQFERYTNVKYDYSKSVATATALFTGKVCLANQ